MSSRHSRNLSASLYIRGLAEKVRYEDLKKIFGRYGRIVDITLPLDYYTRDAKGYGFVEYEESRDAEEALHALDRYRLLGRELEVEFARGDRKTPSEMRSREKEARHSGSRGGGGGGEFGRRDRSRSRDRRQRSGSPVGRDRRRGGTRSRSPYSRSPVPRRYEDLKKIFGRYGRIVDITLPLDYYTRDAKGFGFVEYEESRDAEEALHALDRYRLLGRELEVEFARGDRKTPSEMRAREKESRHSGGRGGGGGGEFGRRDRSRSRDRRQRSGSPVGRDRRRGGTRSRSPYSRSPVPRR
ncbi:unnamed protein product [Adineta steineri]|uniref:RRM domain-containing protein n=2 Tax=Adineta steineri TaxID=433720 RepID=A0A814DLG3_9BILA|nr:unnamed protein product [Adineta steineri]